MTLSERMVEAAAIALSDLSDMGWRTASEYQQAEWRHQARAALTAARAVAEEAGAGVFVVPGEASYTPLSIDAPAQPSGHLGGYIDGHNACRAATLAGRVTL